MGVFGPKYPDPLQAVINHAERLCTVLARLEERHVDPRLWLGARREEIGLVLRLRVRDWRAHRISLGFAARSISSYLDDLHAGAMSGLGLPANAPLACCAEEGAPTVRLASAANTRERLVTQGKHAPNTGETWFDLNALLDLGPSAAAMGE